MARFSGKTGSFSTSSTYIGVESMDIDYKGDAIDVTGMDSSGAKAFIAGLTEWSAEVTGFVNGAISSLVPGTTVTAGVWSTGSTGAPKFTGSGIITGLKVNSTVAGAVNVTVSVQGSGVLTVGTV